MRKFLPIWFISSIVFYLLTLSLFFVDGVERFSADEFSVSMTAMEMLLLFCCLFSFIFSSIAYHPKNKKIFSLESVFFRLQCNCKYLFLILSFLFAKIYGFYLGFIVISIICFFVETIIAFRVVKKIRNLDENLLIDLDELKSLRTMSHFKDINLRFLVRQITVGIAFVVLLILSYIDSKQEHLTLLIKFILMFIGMPILWGVAGIFDFILNKQRMKNKSK
ncbi:MAG: hypothetical protein LBU60_04780 [Clostridiales bacterium]|jgi:hypothetical protein|nr:hypothetical protein [Clostridiales bacterium]